MKIILNGNIVSANLPLIYPDDRGLLLGDGLFETIKAQQGNLLFFKEHYERLILSAKKLSMPLQYSLLDLKKQCQQLLKINTLSDAAIRITLTRGRSITRGISFSTESPTLMMTVVPYAHPSIQEPTAYITDIKRNEYSLLTALKTLNYLEPILAKKQAIQQGYTEGIMINTKGAVTETSIGNVFAVIDQKVFTPHLNEGLLPGIVRQAIINSCAKMDNPIIETTLYPADLLKATEIFQTNSLLEIQSFAKINEHPLFTQEQAIFTQKIFNAYQRDKNL